MFLFLIFLVVSVITCAQTNHKDSVDIASNYARVIVKITAQTSPITKTGQSIVDKEIILSLSKLKPLKQMNYQLKRGILELNLNLVFRNMNSYYKWREKEETNKQLMLVSEKFKGYNIEITFIKQAQID